MSPLFQIANPWSVAVKARWLRRLAFVALSIALLLALAYFGAERLLTIDRPAATSDVIIVLGGETQNRSARAVQLYQQGVARHVIVSGGGDAELIQRRLVAAGVPRTAIVLEPDSTTTWENAVLTSRWLRQARVQRAVLVTSWFHTRRALATFRRVVPGVEFSVAAAPYDFPEATSSTRRRGSRIFSEYAKLAGYLFRHGVWPV